MTVSPDASQTDAPLSGLRVIDFGQFIAAPSAGQILADLGADVIKVEPPGGDASRRSGWQADDCGPMFSAYNRGKRSIVLDLRQEADRRAARALIDGADVVLQNARPGVMEKYGLGAATLRANHPRLVYGSVDGFGNTGPAAARPGLDIAAQAESGMMSINGDAHADPTRIGFTVVDVMAGRTLATGVLAALVRRGIAGQGAHVRVSLIDVALDMLSQQWAEFQLHGTPPSRCGNGQATLAPAADVIATGAGQVVVSAYLQDHFARLCQCIGRPELTSDARFHDNAARVANRAALREALAEAFHGLTADQVCARLTEAGVVCGVVRDLGDAVAHAAATMPERVIDVPSPGPRSLRMPALPISIDDLPVRAGALPGIGEHTREVLGELA
ncbi:CaiB/BaiF CoA transferase family protein [Cupriavidus agavae]|uniref:Crotonobetainyl-CoA:carnitine CoA-transferase CaiB-like acyl-CoA transferase n=1 Tax=Cupriavidus agavae TaxID=1001822 RepID=A0A4Q7RDZ5_9BURK|nr:CoA transferase [Cupriavidus agavae]RZT31386.1 crotonobetainyl-CoA:carnitine CoA-transferase CaiB-like acyl-CoA transferase [Cupriavidus agavae]